MAIADLQSTFGLQGLYSEIETMTDDSTAQIWLYVCEPTVPGKQCLAFRAERIDAEVV